MGKIIENNLIIKIDKIRPNDYNIKLDHHSTNEGRVQFVRVKQSLMFHGQMESIKVRYISDEDYYEIINGYLIWSAMKELGFEEAEVKNFGGITREEAIKKYLSLEELKIPLDVIEVSQLLKKIKESDISLRGFPYAGKEIDEKIKLLDFDWDQFNEENKQLGLLGDFSKNEELEKEIEEEIKEETEIEIEKEIESSVEKDFRKPAFEEKDNNMQTKSLGDIRDEDIKASTGVDKLL